MKISILGGAGFLGRKIAARLAQDGKLGDRPITALTLFDLAAPSTPRTPHSRSLRWRATSSTCRPRPSRLAPTWCSTSPPWSPPRPRPITTWAAASTCAAPTPWSMPAAASSTTGASRRAWCSPRPVASFSGGQDAVLGDDARQVPANSYGAQKAAAELILADASRRGFLDAVSIRLPTIIVRPGRPNRAASSFLSAIVREPLLGLPAELPVPDAFAAWVASPRRAVDWLLHAAAMDTTPMGLDRSINPPGISTTIAHLLQALEAVKPGASALVRRVEDKDIAAIVGLWPPAFEPVRARTLGFASHEPVVDVVRAFVEDDLEATRAERGMLSRLSHNNRLNLPHSVANRPHGG